jgi:hypothetical protein
VRYLLDANVFIAAKRLHYGFDFCPAFWDWLVDQNRAGKVYSIEQVGAELVGPADELSSWANSRGDVFFLKTDAATLTAFATVSSWVMGQGYTAAAINTFLQVADSFLVSRALAHGLTVVTHETPQQSPSRVKLPNACVAHSVAWATPYAMLRRERARFVLGKKP